MMIESLTSRLTYLSDNVINSLLNLVNAIEITEDEANYITYGKDETEHILSNPVDAQRLRESIKDIEQGNTISMTLAELKSFLLGSQGANLHHDPDAPLSIDGYLYIRYGKDETEHLMASPANAERLNN